MGIGTHTSQRQIPRILTAAQVEGAFAHIPVRTLTGLRHRAMLECLYSAGLRASEAVGLREEDVDFGNGLLLIRHTKRDKSRNVPFDERLKDWLLAYRARRDKERGEKAPPVWFFCSSNGVPLSRGSLWRAFRQYADAAGLPDWASLHTLRHTYATELVEANFGVQEIQQLLGHSSISTTGIYLHARPVALAEKIRLRERAGTV
jgi:integrase/recombinase XerD